MDLSINYPYGIPFYSNQEFISINIINNEDDILKLYFVKQKKITGLAGIIFSHEKKKYRFPKKSICAMIADKKPNKVQCFIKLQDGWTYTYP
jgi:hypothetical protein|tara:strand:+ start:1493 stop:1768 length:276 start_codon:yes stop_codon:yes gene_type:complete